MKLKKHAPTLKDYTRSTITEMANVERVKIIVMRKYHNPFINVKKINVKIILKALTQKIKNVKKRIVKFLLSTTMPRVSKMILSPKKL